MPLFALYLLYIERLALTQYFACMLYKTLLRALYGFDISPVLNDSGGRYILLL